METTKKTDLQFFAEGGDATAGDGSAGANTAADAGQQTAAAENAAERKSWAEVREDYRGEFDAEVQSIVQKRLKNLQERLRRAEEKSTPSEGGAPAREAQPRQRALAAALRQREAEEHFRSLCAEAEELRQRVPDFDLMREMHSDAFAELTRPGSKVSLEQAYYAVHPDFRMREAEAVARRTAEAVSAAVSAGAARPQENGAQAASLGALSYRDMTKEQREALRRRIYAAGAKGAHLPAGG